MTNADTRPTPEDVDELLRAGYRPAPEHVALLMGATVRDADQPGYIEYVRPETGVAVGYVPRDPRR